MSTAVQTLPSRAHISVFYALPLILCSQKGIKIPSPGLSAMADGNDIEIKHKEATLPSGV